MRIGCIDAVDTVHLNSPYLDTRAMLCFRSDKTILFALYGDGQMLSGDRHGAIIRIGDGPARSFSLEEPSDYSSDRAFIVPAGSLFAAAMAGKSISIEATYYQAGSQTLTFAPTQPLDLASK
jgi:hypothetical protein